MSDKCANCDCADKSSCVKQGYTADIIETKMSYDVEETIVMEHDGCKCGSTCACTNCTCNH